MRSLIMWRNRCHSGVIPYLRMKPAQVVHAIPCENLRKINRGRHCSGVQRGLIKMLIGEGKTYKEVQKMTGCSAKLISNVLKWKAKSERCGRKRKTTFRMGWIIARMPVWRWWAPGRSEMVCSYLWVLWQLEDTCVRLIYWQEAPAKSHC